jgi:hypothetical protein
VALVTRQSWSRLTTFLESEPDRATVLSFQQIERILGHSLPASAHRHAAFWSNASSYSYAWREAGRDVSRRGLPPGQVRFSQRPSVPEVLSVPEVSSAPIEPPRLHLVTPASRPG